jgi:hypothetical protein
MESAQSASAASPATDVLHSDHHSSLTPEEIAKAIAHHKHHHTGEEQKAQQQAAVGKRAAIFVRRLPPLH